MLLACYTIKVYTWPETILFNSDNLCIIAKEGIVLLKYWGGQEMSQPDDRGIEISNVPSEARSAEGGVGAVASIPPNLKSKSGACSHHIWAYVPPTFGLNPIPLPLRASFLSCFLSMALSAPFLPLFCTPLPYALSPFPSTFPSSSHSRSFLFPFPRGPIPS